MAPSRCLSFMVKGLFVHTRNELHLRKVSKDMGCWIHEPRLYENRSIAHYVAMCIRDDHLLSGQREPKIQVFQTRKGRYGVKYEV